MKRKKLSEMDEIPAALEEPIPCPECGEWVELQSTRSCAVCQELFCKRCLEDNQCLTCRQNEEMP